MDECIIKLEETFGCAKQYICELEVYLITMISLTLEISTCRAVGSYEHSKDVVDGLNERNKRHFKEKWTVYQKYYHNFWRPAEKYSGSTYISKSNNNTGGP